MSAVDAQSSLSLPLSPSRKYPIHIEGKARVFTTYLPMDEVDKMNEPSSGQVAPRQVFMYAWVDKNNGASAHVSTPSDEDGGRFALKMHIKDGDSPALKLHVSVRTQDQETKNFRTFPLAVSCSDLETLLTGQEDSFCMEDQFMEGNFVSVSLRMVNADLYRNHPASSTDPSKPLIKFGATALDKISECNKIMARISNEIQQNIDTNKMVVAPGFSNFKSGLTRCPCPPPVLFLSLMLGTPAYVLLLPELQSGVWREKVLGGRQAATGQQDPSCAAAAGDERQPAPEGQGHPYGADPLRGHARAGGDPAARASGGARPLSSPSQAGPLRRDGGVHTRNERRSIWNPLRAGPAVYLRPWFGPLSKGWDLACCLPDSGDGSLASQPGAWVVS